MRQSILTLLGMLLCWQLMAQHNKFTSLSIGDPLPKIPATVQWVDSSMVYNITRLKSKLILLDFWNTSCTACIAAMPKMESLQQRFKDKIQIIYITGNTRQEVATLFSKIKIKRPHLPMIVNDTIFNSLFPHEGDPHHVWINPEGNVQFITYDYNATARNIQDVLDGKKLHFSLKREIGRLDPSQSFFSEVNAAAATQYKAYASLLLKGLQDYISSSRIVIQRDTLSGCPFSIRTLNVSLFTLYALAFNKELYGFDIDIFNLPNNNRILLEVKNSEAFTLPIENEQKDSWKAENLFSYELYIPVEKATNFYQVMQEDLNRYLNYKATIEIRKMKCLVLVVTDKSKLPVTAQKDHPEVAFGKDGSFIMHGAPLFPNFIQYVVYANQKLPTPFIDDTGYKEALDIAIEARLDNLTALRKELSRYGLDIIESDKEVTMLVIRDKK